MSILTEHIQSEIRLSVDLAKIEEGLRFLSTDVNILQEWSIVAATKNLASSIKQLPSTIKDLPNYRMAVLQGKTGKYFLIRDMGKFELIFYDKTGNFVREMLPVNEFEKKIEEIRSQGNEVVRDYNGIRKFVVWFLVAGVKRGYTQLAIAGIIAILLGMVIVFPSIATISILGTSIGALAGALGATTMLGFAKFGIINLTIGKVSSKTLTAPHQRK